jgi:hypothetical protein
MAIVPTELLDGPAVDYTTLSLAEVTTALDDVARDAQATFARLNARQLNWRPDAARWSVGQCFEHLLIANRLMMRASQDALLDRHSPTIWERLPLLPRLVGGMLIRSQTPGSSRKFTAPRPAQPAASDIAPDVVHQFVDQQRNGVAWMMALDESVAARTIMTSPFVRVITYSVLDGCRLIVAHDRRHVEQARRVMLAPEFPAG